MTQVLNLVVLRSLLHRFSCCSSFCRNVFCKILCIRASMSAVLGMHPSPLAPGIQPMVGLTTVQMTPWAYKGLFSPVQKTKQESSQESRQYQGMGFHCAQPTTIHCSEHTAEQHQWYRGTELTFGSGISGGAYSSTVSSAWRPVWLVDSCSSTLV